jgi:hypothetical protein
MYIDLGVTIDTIQHIRAYFRGGIMWKVKSPSPGDTRRSLLHAASEIGPKTSSNATRHFLQLASEERYPGKRFYEFEFTAKSFDEVAAILDRAEELAWELVRWEGLPDKESAIIEELYARKSKKVVVRR